jgi:hypothetical protein
MLRYPIDELIRMKELFFPEERRHEFTSERWDGVSFRHYRDPRIVCLEHYRPKDQSRSPNTIPQRTTPAA